MKRLVGIVRIVVVVIIVVVLSKQSLTTFKTSTLLKAWKETKTRGTMDSTGDPPPHKYP